MAKIKDSEDKFTIDPSEAVTKIQLLTKTSPNTGDDKVDLSEITLDQGEPLVNTNDKTLIIGTTDNKAANDVSTIVLGNGRNVITNTDTDNTITLQHFDGNHNTPRSSQNISINGGTLSADDAGNVSIDTRYTISTGVSDNVASINLKGADNDTSSSVNLEAGTNLSNSVNDGTITYALVTDPKVESLGIGSTNQPGVTLQYDSTLNALKFVFN